MNVLAQVMFAAGGGDGPFDAAALIIGHVSNSEPWGPEGWGLSKAVLLMAISATLVLVGVRLAARGYDQDGVPTTRWAQMLDPFIQHFYEDVALQYCGKKWAAKVAPLLLNFFFFILTCNLLGLVPWAEVVGLTHYALNAGSAQVATVDPAQNEEFDARALILGHTMENPMLIPVNFAPDQEQGDGSATHHSDDVSKGHGDSHGEDAAHREGNDHADEAYAAGSSSAGGYKSPAVTHGAATATGNFNVTMTLATITFFAILFFGIRENGVVKHFAHLAGPKSAPMLVRILLLIPIETLSMFVKPFALTMRLAANMTAGHMGILALVSIIFILNTPWVGIPVVGLAVAMMMLEIIVSFVQAYVFALLSGVFIGMALEHH